MSKLCDFNTHIDKVRKSCSRMVGWILRTFSARDCTTMLTLFKSIVLPILEYTCQLWNPKSLNRINKLEKVQRSFTKHITGMFDLPYEDRLQQLKLYSLQRRRDRYQIIYIWKIMESLVANLDPPIAVSTSSRLGRMCVKSTVPRGHIGTLVYNSFKSNGIRLINSLPPAIRNITETDGNIFKQNLDHFLHSVTDEPCKSFFDNSIDKRIEQSSTNSYGGRHPVLAL